MKVSAIAIRLVWFLIGAVVIAALDGSVTINEIFTGWPLMGGAILAYMMGSGFDKGQAIKAQEEAELHEEQK